MRVQSLLALTIAVVALPAAARAEVQLSIANGNVSIIATDATVREILAEWARVGGTVIVNGDKVVGPPMTLQITNEPEEKALKTILRSAGGYVAAPRIGGAPNGSRFERILLMPAGPPPSRAAAPPPSFPQPRFTPPIVDDPGDEDEPPSPEVVIPAPAPPRGPVFNTYPPANAPANAPAQQPGTMPAGVSVPGMVVPAPQQQDQPGQPGGPPREPDSF